MGKKLMLICMALVVFGCIRTASAELVGYWSFDEGSGGIAKDESGNGNDGTLENGTEWTAGKFGAAVQFDGTDDYVNLGNVDTFSITGDLTFSLWVKISAYPTSWRNMLSKLVDDTHTEFNFRYKNSTEAQFYYGTGSAAIICMWNPSEDLPLDTWTHIAGVRKSKSYLKLYFNGIEKRTSNITTDPVSTDANVTIGRQSNSIFYFNGMIDEVAIFTDALEEADIQSAMSGLGSKERASKPTPAIEAIDVPRDATLRWIPGQFAVKHDVYLGTVFDNVNDASAANTPDVLVSPGQTGDAYDAGILDYGKTYYWRVDEVNGAPDNTIFTGDVWRFTVEPLAIPIETITATASGANAGMGPEKTVDGSGLNEWGQHSTSPADMWLTLTANSWIQYEFDKVYKLHDMLVWNSNQAIETFIGFGVRDAIVETSLDDIIWTAVEGVGPFAQGSAQATYETNTTVDLSGIVAKYVKITPQNAHGITGQSGLSEVRFSRIPTEPREFLPVDGSTSARVDVGLSWRGGREAAAHELYLGSDPADLALAATTGDPSFVAEGLDYGQTYYWQVIEVNEAETPARYAGDILSFSTAAYAVVDDFESYSGEEGQEIFMTWFDGFGGDASLGGSTTGHIDGPFVETSIVNNGKQSMPVYVDNDGGFFNIDGKMSSPTFSEVVRDLDGQDWTASGIKTLSIMFAGSTGLTGQLYCKIGSTKLLYDGDTTNLGIGAWQAWNIDLSTVGGNLTNVRELAIGVEGGTSGILYLDDIRLYTRPGEFVTPVQPDIANLVAYYPFDGDLQDAAGSHHGTIDSGTPVFVDGAQGQAIEFIGNQQVIVAYADDLALNSFTLSTWINVSNIDGNRGILSTRFNGDQTFDLKVDANRIHGDVGSGTAWLNTSVDLSTQLHTGTWYHIAYVIDEANSTARIYLNGVLAETLAISGTPLFMKVGQELHIGNSYGVVEYMHGTLDEVALYNRALSSSEIAGLAGMTKQTHKPF
jgi:hypothetical protein